MHAASASSFSASSGRPASLYCCALSLRCFTNFWMIFTTSWSVTSPVAPSAVLASIMAALIALSDARRTVSFAFIAATMSACILFSICILFRSPIRSGMTLAIFFVVRHSYACDEILETLVVLRTDDQSVFRVDHEEVLQSLDGYELLLVL